MPMIINRSMLRSRDCLPQKKSAQRVRKIIRNKSTSQAMFKKSHTQQQSGTGQINVLACSCVVGFFQYEWIFCALSISPGNRRMYAVVDRSAIACCCHGRRGVIRFTPIQTAKSHLHLARWGRMCSVYEEWIGGCGGCREGGWRQSSL